MAHGLASGWIEWGGQRYEFTDAPHYVVSERAVKGLIDGREEWSMRSRGRRRQGPVCAPACRRLLPVLQSHSRAHPSSNLPLCSPHCSMRSTGAPRLTLGFLHGPAVPTSHNTSCPPPPAHPIRQEKNWGGGFPRRWCWVQCNSFAGEAGTSVTAVGALRGLLGVPGVEENVGMIGIHHR